MRRIWAHVIIAITTIVMMIVTFCAVTNNLNVGLDYATGKTITYQITEKTDNGEDEIVEFGDDSLAEVAEKMENRIKEAEIDNYDIAVFGKNLIKVTLYQESVEYSQIDEYLRFNGDLYLYSYDSEGVEHYVSSTAFVDPEKPAYVEDNETNGYHLPSINIPVDIEDPDYKDVVLGAANSTQIMTQEASSEDADDAQYAKFMYLVYGYVPGRDSFDDTENFESKVLLKYQIKENSSEDVAQYFDYFVDDDDVYSLSTVLNIADEQGNVSEENIKTAWTNATFYTNLLNAGKYDFDVTKVHEEIAYPTVESLYSLKSNQTVFGSKTFIAFACAVILVALILVVFYRLGALSISVVSLASTFLGILFLMIFSSEFNLFAVVGLILVAFASIASGCVYMNKLKDECYKGRSIKKANTEASKKSTLVVVDIHVALIILGAFCYLLGGVIMKSFALATVLGGLTSLILNLVAFKGFLWLDTNASYAQGKYELFGVDKNKVPSLLNEEKQSYFGPYAEKNFTGKSKLATLITGIAAVVCLAAILGWGIGNKSVYNNPAKEYSSEIYIKIDNENDIDLTMVTENIQSVIGEIKDGPSADAKSLSEYVTTPVLEDMDILEYDEGVEGNYYMHCYAEYIISVKEELPNELLFKGSLYKTEDLFGDNSGLIANEIGEYAIEVQLAKGETISAESPVVGKVFLGVGVALAVTALYLLIRYKLSRGIASFVTSLAGTTVIAGLLSLLYFIPAGNTVAIGAVFAEFAFILFAILFMDKERDLVLDDRKHDNSYENRNELMNKAISYGFGDSLNIAIIGLYLGINFFGFGPAAFHWSSVLMILAIAGAFAVSVFVLGPISQFFFKKFASLSVEKPRKAKNRANTQNKSAEPEEAIFIGIND